MSLLYSPLQLKSIELKNRIVMSPMCQYSATDGLANNWHLVHYGTRAVGGAGLIIVEACAVSPEGRITSHDLGIWDDEHIAPLSAITNFITLQGSVAAIQLAHAGRKASCSTPWNGGHQLPENSTGWKTVAPSCLPFRDTDCIPHALSIEEIKIIVDHFKFAAQRALKAGFKIIEIHAAHGYLIHQFLSPISNQRTDEYGGSFINRTRFLLEVIDAINTVWPNTLPVFVRISATEWIENGWDINDSIALALQLKSVGIELIDCSSGGNIGNAKIPLSPGYQVQLSKQIKESSSIKTGTVGLITSAEHAEEILQNNEADLILFGRELLRNPYFGLTAASNLAENNEWPLQYQRAKQ